MMQFTIAQTPIRPGQPPCWSVTINGAPHRQYSSQWAAIIGTFVAAHDATHRGEEATVVMETSGKQMWTFSLMPGGADDTERSAA
jgi:hypothetical protein